MDNKKGIFIAFDGIDGCGKTTQTKKFSQHLFDKNKYNHVVLTRNPYKDTNIRVILNEDEDPITKASKLADLFINDRHLHVEEVVKPALLKGHHVVTDRFMMSTLAFQTSQGMSMDDLINRHKEIVRPDINFIIDIPAFVARDRMEKEKKRDFNKFEKDLEFSEKVRQNYLKCKDVLVEDKIFIIDGTKSKDEIFLEICEIFEKEF